MIDYSSIGCLYSILSNKSLRFIGQRIFDSLLYVIFKVHNLGNFSPNGDGEIRTLDPLLARQVLSQLSYTPTNTRLTRLPVLGNIKLLFYAKHKIMGLSGLEPPTSRLSGVRSNQLSYKPINLATSYSSVSSPTKYHQPIRS